MSDQEPRAIVIKAAIIAEAPASAVVGDLDEIPGTKGGPSATAPPARYIAFELTRRWHPERRGDADLITGWAVATHYHAPNLSDVRLLRKCVTAALEGRAYDVPGGDTIGPFSFEDDGGFDFVDGAWSGFDTWRA